MDDDGEASLYVDQEPRLGEPLFVGGFIEACKTIWSWTTEIRRTAQIEMPLVTCDAGQQKDMRRDDEGEI